MLLQVRDPQVLPTKPLIQKTVNRPMKLTKVGRFRLEIERNIKSCIPYSLDKYELRQRQHMFIFPNLCLLQLFYLEQELLR